MRTRVAALLVALTALFAATSAVAPGTASAQTTSRAVVIVDRGSLGGGVHTSVIEFSGSVSGLEALQLAGASPETITYGSLGQAVCKLFGAGDAAVPGQCPGGWVYFRAPDGAGGWSQSSLGASNTVVHDGDVEGWRYGGGAPPFQSFCAVAGCAPPPTTPTAAPAVPGGGGSTGGDVSVAGATAGGDTATGATPGTAAAGSAGDPAGPVAASGATATTSTPQRASTGSDRRVGRTVAAGAGAASTGGGGGSPVGVIVAAVVVTALVGGGFALRRGRAA